MHPDYFLVLKKYIINHILNSETPLTCCSSTTLALKVILMYI